MRFYIQPRQFYCGIDLHTRKMYVCILSQTGAEPPTGPFSLTVGYCWMKM